MPLDFGFKILLDRINGVPSTPMDKLSPEEFRRQAFKFPVRPIEVKEVYDKLLPLPGRDIPVRVYVAESSGEVPSPALIYYHGGGWVTGGIEQYDSLCRALTNLGRCTVISVGYRLAPEHKFPAAVNDAYDALVWISSHVDEFLIDRDRIAVGGDSAGGNLATVACIIAKERMGPQIAYQFLLYPSTGFVDEPPSMQENATGYLLNTDMMHWFRKHYLNSMEELLHPYVSPVLYPDLTGLPPAFIATAEFDPLRDVGLAYAAKLRENGVDVTSKNFAGMIHVFANFYGFVPGATKALNECGEILRHALHHPLLSSRM
jgi:acetyl esterase